MIKIKGLNCRKSDGDYSLFGYCNGNGNGNEIRLCYFSSSFGNGSGNGYSFGYLNGNGYSSDSKVLKEEFKK